MSLRLNFKKARNFIFAVIIISISFVGGYYLGVQGYKAEVTKTLEVTISRQIPLDKNVDFTLFWQVWDTVSSKYFDKTKLDPTQMVYGAVSGMVSSIGDPYTMFLPPTQNKIVNENLNGNFEGVGISIGYREGTLAVLSPLPESPAEKSGVKAGDYIVHIKDERKNIDTDSSKMALDLAVAYIRGSAGSKVTLTLIRDGNTEPIIVDLIRAKLEVPSLNLTWVGDNSNIANIQISTFGAETPKEWDKAVRQITDRKDVAGIIIDLRNNGGGYMQDAIDIASDFVPYGKTIVIQENGNGTKQNYKSQKSPRLLSYKTVVLVNKWSASASEILAGALRDISDIKLIGDKSFGKGTIQEPIDIAGGSGIHITTARWLTPNGTWVHDKGLTPDKEIVNEDVTNDLQLKTAIEYFK
jgi:carboxyl-terminal processing protease